MFIEDERVVRTVVEWIHAGATEGHFDEFLDVVAVLADKAQKFMVRLQAAFEEKLPKLEARMTGVALAIYRSVEILESSPPSVGIEPLLMSTGMPPLTGRIYARIIARFARQYADEIRLEGELVIHIRRIAKARNVGLACRKAAPVLFSPCLPELQGRVLEENGVSAEEFLAQCRLAAAGERMAQALVKKSSAALALQLLKKSGRKPSLASCARELIEVMGPPFAGLSRYTYSDELGDFCDPITLALRKEFDEPRFNPRAAYQRSLARKAIT